MTHPGGRPLKYANPDALQALIDDYFACCDRDGRPYTISGMAYHLDTTRDVILDYCERDEFTITIKKAKARILARKEEWLTGGKGSTVGLIFDLKNNHGWRDQRDVEVSGGLDIGIEVSFKTSGPDKGPDQGPESGPESD